MAGALMTPEMNCCLPLNVMEPSCTSQMRNRYRYNCRSYRETSEGVDGITLLDVGIGNEGLGCSIGSLAVRVGEDVHESIVDRVCHVVGQTEGPTTCQQRSFGK